MSEVPFEQLPPYWQRQIKKLRSEAFELRMDRNRLRDELAAISSARGGVHATAAT